MNHPLRHQEEVPRKVGRVYGPAASKTHLEEQLLPCQPVLGDLAVLPTKLLNASPFPVVLVKDVQSSYLPPPPPPPWKHQVEKRVLVNVRANGLQVAADVAPPFNVVEMKHD